MIHIKIYGKGRGKTHIYANVDYSGQQMADQLTALLMTTCQIARDAISGLDKDEFLRIMGRAWDMQEERSNRNE